MKHILRHYLSYILVGLGITDLIVGLHLDWAHLGSAFVLFYTLVIPGLLLLSFFVSKKMPVALGIAISVALSVLLLMLLGLGINTFLPMLGVHDPLRTIFLLPAFNGLILLLFAASLFAFRPVPIEIPGYKRIDKMVLLASLAFPVLAVLGATTLNNGGSNYLTMTCLGLIAAFVPLIILMRKRLHVSTPPVVLFFMALALLLMNSMRGWFITGHDVLLEYYVFRLTDTAQAWDMNNFRDPYNACLSITLLPTYLHSMLHITDTYIFKFVFQLIAALPVIPIYYLCRRYVSNVLAFLAGFLYISFPTFMTDTSMLNRQSVALLFFGLLIYVMLSNYYIVGRWRTRLLLLLGAGMIISHYSTSYVAVALLTFAYCINWFLRFFMTAKRPAFFARATNVFRNKIVYGQPVLLTLPLVLGLIIMSSVWSGPITHTSKGITTTLKQIASSITKPFSQEETGAAKYSFSAGKQPSKQELFDQFMKQNLKQDRYPAIEDNLFPLSLTESAKYKSSVSAEPMVPLGPVGKKLNNALPIRLGALYDNIKQAYAKVLQALLIIGLSGMAIGFTFKRSLRRNVPAEYIAISMAGVLLIIVQVVIPGSAIDYGLLRLFQQNLVLLALPISLGFLFIAQLVLRRSWAALASYSILLLMFFVVLSGFVPQLTGGSRPALPLNNGGFYYDAYYTHAEEVAGFVWLKEVYDAKYPLQSDRYFVGTKMQSYVGLAPETRLLPGVVKRNSYVILGYTNARSGNVIEFVNGDVVYYRLPITFLDDNKNEVYNAGASVTVYK